uniref:Uncharacterized protein n=1 Tax=Panagrellus redivivus TaxID=6233 RepID=A0A7E4UP61_PANRE
MTLNIAAFCVVLAACVAPMAAYYPYQSYFNQDVRAFSPYGQQQQLVGLPAAYGYAQQQQQLLRAQMLGQQGYGGFDPSIGWQQQQQQQLLRQQLLQQQYNPYYAQQQQYGGYGGYGNGYGAGGYGNGYGAGQYGGYGNVGAAHYHPGYMHTGPFVTRDVSKATGDEKA